MEKHSNTMIDPKNHSGYITLEKGEELDGRFHKMY